MPSRTVLAQLLLLLLLLILLPLCALRQSPRPVAAAVIVGGLLALAAIRSLRGHQAAAEGTPTKQQSEAVSSSPRRSGRRLQELPLSGQISADYSEAEDSLLRGVGDLPTRLFRVARLPTNPLVLTGWSCVERAAEQEATVRLTRFSWTVSHWSRGARSVRQLESPEFTDPLMPGVAWRCLLRRKGRRLQVMVKAALLEPVEFPEGRLFAELTCACGGVSKRTFGAFYPGVFEFAMCLEEAAAAEAAAADTESLTVACTAAVLVSVPVSQLPLLPPACQTDGQGRYVNCHPTGIRWQLTDWHRLAWQPGEAAFSPLFSSASLPGWLWQVHLYPASDEPSTAGQASVFLKLVDAAGPTAGPLEADFELALVPGVVDLSDPAASAADGLFDTVEFARGDAHGFRGVAPLVRLRAAGPLLVECALRVKMPLFT